MNIIHIYNEQQRAYTSRGVHQFLFLVSMRECHNIQHIGGVALDNFWTNPVACLWYHNIWVLLKECCDLRYQKLLIDLKRPRMEFSFGLFRVGFYQWFPRQPSLSNDVYESRTGCRKVNRGGKDSRKAGEKQPFRISSISMTTAKLGGNCQIVSHRLFCKMVWPLQV